MPRIVLALWRSAFPRVILRHTTHVRKGTCEHVAQMCEDASERVAVAWAFGGGHTPPPCVLRRADRLDVTDEQIFSEITKQALRQIHLSIRRCRDGMRDGTVATGKVALARNPGALSRST